MTADFHPIGQRFRGFLPVAIDVETGGFNAHTDALLEIAAVLLESDAKGFIHPSETLATHVKVFEGANLEPASLSVTGIDPYHPLRIAVPEREALEMVFKAVRSALKRNECQRAILLGHNAAFDLAFVNAAVARTGIKRNPFHLFSSLDTVTLGAVAFGQTVLARAVKAARLGWEEEAAHSAVYDAQKTAELFCAVVNRWRELAGEPVGAMEPSAGCSDPDASPS